MAASSHGVEAPPIKTVCSADLVCVRVYQKETVRLVLDNKSTKPLSFKLFLQGSLAHVKLDSQRLQQPESIQLLRIPAPQNGWGFEFRLHYGHTPGIHDDDTIYSLPYAVDARYRVTQSHDSLSTHHPGNIYAIDWAIPEGEPVYAARKGIVVSLFENSSANSSTGEATANHIWIEHDDGTIAKYLHLAHKSVLVQEGDSVSAGEEIAAVGNTGYSSGAHLHFSVSALGGAQLYRSFNVRFETHTGPQKMKFGDNFFRP